MNKILRYSFIALMAMMGINLYADDVTIDFTAKEYTNAQEITIVEQDGITLTFDKGTNSNTPKYYTTGTAVRCYSGNSMKMSASFNIAKVVFTFASGEGSNEITVDAGTFETDTWTGDAKEITFTIGGTSGHRRIQKLVISKGASNSTKTATAINLSEGYVTKATPGKDETLALPTATVKAGDATVEGATVTWTSSDEKLAKINGSNIELVNPTDGGTVTIKAEYAGNDIYEASSANYKLNVYKGYLSLTEMVKDVTNGNEKWKDGVMVSYWNLTSEDPIVYGEALVTYVNGPYTYINDGVTNMLLYGSNLGLNAGDKITSKDADAIYGTLKVYNGLPELAVSKSGDIGTSVVSSGNTVEPTVITVDKLDENVNAYVKIENAVLVDGPTNKNYTFKVGDTSFTVRQNWTNVSVDALEKDATYTLVGTVAKYNDAYQLYLISFEAAAAPQESGLTWDFTKWSDATITNLKAEAAKVTVEEDTSKANTTKCTDNGALWSDHEKAAQCTTYADSKDKCFWCIAEPNADGELSANGVVIEELKGLKFQSGGYSTNRSLAIAVNYSSTSLGTYAGPAYLWLGGKEKLCFTIPAVAAGSTITMVAESHKPAEGRGVQLKQGDTQIGEDFAPTIQATNSWKIETEGDVDVWNTNGCHIYKITVEAGVPTAISTAKTAIQQNGITYNLAGQAVNPSYKGIVIRNGKKFVNK